MKCLVLAAGHGSRLREVSPSKPLAPLAGTPLIEHVIRRAAAGGATDFTIVTGHEAERLEAFLDGLGARTGLSIQWVRTPDWDRPNGLSVVAGAEAIDGNYLLLMSDHLFDPDIIGNMIGRGHETRGVTLAVDRTLIGPLLDIEDATKVEVGGSGEILRIGKGLASYNAIDTGIFIATPALSEAIRAVVASGGGGSLSEGVQQLADRGLASTIDVEGRAWIDVDDPRALALAETLLETERQPATANAT